MTFELRSERRNQGRMGPAREGKLRGRKRLRGVGGASRRPHRLDRREEGRSEGDEVRGLSDKVSQATRRTLVFPLGASK